MFYFLETHKFIALGALTFICWLSVFNCEPKIFRHLFARRISSAFNQIGPSSVEILLVELCVAKLKHQKAGIYFSRDGLEQNYGLCLKIGPSHYAFLLIPKINNEEWIPAPFTNGTGRQDSLSWPWPIYIKNKGVPTLHFLIMFSKLTSWWF